MKSIKIEILEDLQGHEMIDPESISDISTIFEKQTTWITSGHLKGYFSRGEFEGWLENGKLKDSGILRASDFEYYGNFEENKAHGFGIYKSFKKRTSTSLEKIIPFKYYGEFENGEINGYGAILFLNGIQFFGEFKNSLLNGMGVLTNPDSRYYAGEFNANKLHGFGMMQLDEKYFYIGKFEFDDPKGCGIISDGKSNYVVSDFNSQENVKVLYADCAISTIESIELCKQLANKRWTFSSCIKQKYNNVAHIKAIRKNTTTFNNFIHFAYSRVSHNLNINHFNKFVGNNIYTGDIFMEEWYTTDFPDGSYSSKHGVKVGEYSTGSFNGIALLNYHHYFNIGHFENDCLCGTGIQLKHWDSYELGFFENNELKNGLYFHHEDGYIFQLGIDSTLNTMCFSFNESSPFECIFYILEKETGEHLSKKHFNFREWM